MLGEYIKRRVGRGSGLDFACIYSQGSAQIVDKQQEYNDRAMEQLKESVKAGWRDATQILKTTDLDPLREREDFKKLLDELEGESDKTKE